MAKRECGTCTKCCEGWLEGEALGYKFGNGKPCGALTIGKGCNSYALRPKEPCVNFKCGWLANEDFPDWMKPDVVNTIVNYAEIKGIPFISAIDSGGPIERKTLSWIIQYALANHLNLVWNIEDGKNWIGSAAFDKAMKS